MSCRVRDELLAAYFRAEDEQAKAASALMSDVAVDRRREVFQKSVNARTEVRARKTDLEVHCKEHGCELHKV